MCCTASSSKASCPLKRLCGQFSRSGRRIEPLWLRAPLKLLRSNQPSGRSGWSLRGTRIAPDLYIACGISGAIQHMVGARSAKAIMAINTDRDAPMVTHATYAVIGDLHTILPAIIAAVRAAK